MMPMKIVTICGLVAVVAFVILLGGIVFKAEREDEKEADENADYDVQIYSGCTVEVWTEVKTGKEITRWYQGEDEDE